MTSEQRIAEWAEQTLEDMRLSWIHNRTPLMNAARTLIASVRAEAAEEFCELFDGSYYGPFEHPSTTIRRALVKERKG